MKAYYEDSRAGITIYHGDCREVLPHLPKVDLVLTDPPYGLKWTGTGFKKQPRLVSEEVAAWDAKPDAAMLALVVSAGKEAIIWGGNYLASALGDFAKPLVWDKETGANTFADGEMAWTSFRTGTLRIFRHQWCGAFKDSERGIRNYHPTQKPVEVMKWCLSLCSGARTVVDPFMGSGTTLVAAKAMGLSAIGIDTSEAYCEIAARRLSQEVLDFGSAA